MAKLQELEKYLYHEFSSDAFTGKDYLTFQTKYINYLKNIAKEYDWELVNLCKNHYCFSAFFKCGKKYIYVSIDDVRFSHNWFNRVLYRTALHEQDYTGGQNMFTPLANLKYAIYGLFEKGFWL